LLVGRDAENLRGRLREVDDVRGRVPTPVAEARGGEREVEACGRLVERALRLPLLGYVARNLRRADDAPARPEDRRDGERDVEERTVLAAANGLVVLYALARAQPREYGRLFVNVVFGYEDGDVLAYS
jgi:hypothetical protein